MKKLIIKKLRIFGFFLLIFLGMALVYTFLFPSGGAPFKEGFTISLAFLAIAIIGHGWIYLIWGILINLIEKYNPGNKYRVYLYLAVAFILYYWLYQVRGVAFEPGNALEHYCIFGFFLLTTWLYTYLEYKLSERWVEDN